MKTMNNKSQSAEAVNSAVNYNVVVRNYGEGFDTLDDAIDYVVMMMKKYPGDAIYVNGMGIRFEKKLDGKWGVALRDYDFKLIAGYVMGKIKRGLRDAVAHVLGYIEVYENENEVEEQSDDVAPVLEKTNLNENPLAGIDVCEYVILNGKSADWNDVFNTIKDMKIDGEYNADIAVLLNKIEQGVYGITLDEDSVCKSLYLMVIGYFMQLRGMLIEIRNHLDENGMEDMAKNDAPCLDGGCCDECNEKVIEKRKEYHVIGDILDNIVEDCKYDDNVA